MKKQGTSYRGRERRGEGERRNEIERRFTDLGAPERRAVEERRQVDMGPPERRHCMDRRDAEVGPPPGWKDRRRQAERRTPEVVEVSFDDWVRMRAVRIGSAAPVTEQEEHHEHFARIIIRD